MTETSESQAKLWHARAPWMFGAAMGSALLLMPLLLVENSFAAEIVYVAVVVLVLWRVSAVVWLVAVQAYLLLRESPASEPVDGMTTAMATLLALLVFVLVDRLHTARRLGTAQSPELTEPGTALSFGRRVATEVERPHDEGAFGGAESSMGAEHWKGLAWSATHLLLTSVLAVGAAWLVLTLVPEDRSAGRSLRLRPSELRAIVLTFVLIIAFFVTSAVVSELSWRRISPRQARIYLRSLLMDWMERDLRLVTRKRRKSAK